MVSGPAAWRYRIGGTERKVSMVGDACKGRFEECAMFLTA